MEQKIKQRLAGVITVVSLAVIFLPLIFDGSGYRRLPDMNLNIPAQPEIIIDQRFEALPASGDGGLKKLREEIDLNTMIKDSLTERSSSEQWKVQVGVFANESNAKNQVKILQEQGYVAQSRSFVQAGVQKFFVEIESENEQEIRQIAEELKSKLGMQDVLVKKQ